MSDVRSKESCSGCSAVTGQQRVEFAALVQRIGVVEAAQVACADEDLRHRCAAAAALHLDTRALHGVDIYFRVLHALAVKELLRARAVRAPRGGVHHDVARAHGAGRASAAVQWQTVGAPARQAATQVEYLGEYGGMQP